MLNKETLLQEIEELEKENKHLKSEIRRIDDYEMFQTVRLNTEIYRKGFYRKIPFTFLETVFYTHKDILLKHANACFIEKVLDAVYDNNPTYLKEAIAHIPMYCNNVYKTAQGYIFSLNDPYRTICTKPMENISDDEAEKCKGRMLIVKIVIPENHRAIKNFEIKGYKPLKLTLTNVFGKSIPTNYSTLFTQFKDVTKEDDVFNAINVIETYYRRFNSYIVIRVNDNILRIITDNKKIGVWFEKDQLWYGEEISDMYDFCLYKAQCEMEASGSSINNNLAYYRFSDEDMFP